MSLLLVVKVETVVIIWNLDLVEQALEVCVSIDRVEKIIKTQRRVLRKGIETIDQNANVAITGRNGRESILLRPNLELASFINLGRPSLDVVVLENWDILDIHFLGSRTGKLLLQRNNLKEMLDH
jgi:hypothetical protein